MDETKDILLNMLENILGKPEKVYDSKLQYGYNCPECDDGKKKGNLEVTLEKHLFHCWSCGANNGTHGSLFKLIRTYGNKEHIKIYKIFQPEEFKIKEKKRKELKLPDCFTLIKNGNPNYPVFKQALRYLRERGVTDKMIIDNNIGFCGTGTHANRIIIPSYDDLGILNYYIARSWIPHTRAKYKNPEQEKDKIIFNESLIDWDEDIYLVEGVFDSIFLPNSIPMLGKHMSELLFNTLYEKVNKNIILALDGDAWQDSLRLYHELNGGRLFGSIKVVKMPIDNDIADLRGKIDDYYYKIK
jgi:DNA primase